MVTRAAKVLGTPSDEKLGWLPKDRDAYAFLRKVCPQSAGVSLDSLFPRASPACLDMLGALLRWDPQQRLSAVDALSHEYLCSFQPREAPIPPEPFDWSFDGFHATADAVKERLYRECA